MASTSRDFPAGKLSRQQASLEESVREEISLRLREKNLESRTKVVEEAVAPLIHEVRRRSVPTRL